MTGRGRIRGGAGGGGGGGTTGIVPMTSTVSDRGARPRRWLATASVSPIATASVAVAKPSSLNVTVTCPAASGPSRYRPAPSVTVDDNTRPSVVDAATVTPGSTPPDSSVTRPRKRWSPATGEIAWQTTTNRRMAIRIWPSSYRRGAPSSAVECAASSRIRRPPRWHWRPRSALTARRLRFQATSSGPPRDEGPDHTRRASTRRWRPAQRRDDAPRPSSRSAWLVGPFRRGRCGGKIVGLPGAAGSLATPRRARAARPTGIFGSWADRPGGASSATTSPRSVTRIDSPRLHLAQVLSEAIPEFADTDRLHGFNVA